jgi:hypothetical protein
MAIVDDKTAMQREASQILAVGPASVIAVVP